jgi:hypothetical protein
MKTRTPATLPASRRPTPPEGRRAGGRWARVRRAAAELAPEAIEQIAHRVAELLRRDQPDHAAAVGGRGQLLDAGQLARQLGLTRAWVYEHANELGAITLGDGPRPRLRFDPEIAEQALQARRRPRAAELPQASDAARPGRPRRRPRSTVPLLPVHEPGARRILSRFVLPRRTRR